MAGFAVFTAVVVADFPAWCVNMKQTTRLHRFFHPMVKFYIMGWKNPCALLAVCLLPMLSPDLSHALEWKDLWQTPDQQGQVLLQQGKSGQAAATFEDPGWKAAALYRTKKYKEAAKALEGIESADAWYNRGNALAKSGDLKAAAQAYEQALKIDKTHEDASFNLELVKDAMQNRQSKQQQLGEKNQDQQRSQSDQNSGQSENESGKRKNLDDSSSDSRQHQKPEQQEKGEAEQSRSSQNDQARDEVEKDKEQEQGETEGQNKAEAEEEKVKSSVQEQEMDREAKEEIKARQQWLRRIPDDPGGLLRRKFRYQYRQRGQQSRTREEQAW
jgi:Ca-activated chloride channel family protein